MHRGLICSALVLGASFVCAASPPYKAGVAKVRITPDEPMWLAGYASRNRPAEGTEHELFAKALALEGPDHRPLVLLTSDLLGFARDISDDVARRLERQTGLPRASFMFTSSHTHCGPVIADHLVGMYPLDDEMKKKALRYTERLKDQLVQLVLDALRNRQPVRLQIGEGKARFAVNRRKPTPQGFINAANPDGPVDHTVPVLLVGTPEGRPVAIVFGYACHNTTLPYYKWCGDYAGFAQIDLEARYPGALAMFWAGCGGDANPLPRGTVELCRKYGKELAVAVQEVLAGSLREIEGPIRSGYREIALPFASTPSRDRLQAEAAQSYTALRNRARRFLKMLDEGQSLPTEYPHYPIQVWHLGPLRWIALGGEVVVDYSHRLKRELGGNHPIWVTAYANDVMAYIPSERVLAEGGYEGDSSMIEYGQPSKWKTGIEEKIVTAVRELIESPR